VSAALDCLASSAAIAAAVGLGAGPWALWGLRRSMGRPPVRSAASQADLAFVLGLLPALLAVGAVVGTLLPSLMTLAGVMPDHCDDHDHHVHLCLVHDAHTPAWWSAVGAIAAAIFTVRATWVAAGALRRHRSIRALERLGTPGLRAGFPTVRVPGAPRLCLATGLFRRRIVYSASLEAHLSAAELDAALAHEAAHLHRRDPLSSAALRVAGLFTLPSVAARIQGEFSAAAERACDAAAAQVHGPETVARALVAAARAQSFASSGLALTGHPLAARVAALLAAHAPRVTPAKGGAVALALCVGVLGTVCVFALELHHAVETLLSLIV
jgi:Zn-dependent protease with chaperone function